MKSIFPVNSIAKNYKQGRKFKKLFPLSLLPKFFISSKLASLSVTLGRDS